MSCQLFNQEDTVDNVFQKQNADLSKSHEVIVTGDFNYPDIFWEINPTKNISARNSSFVLLIISPSKGEGRHQGINLIRYQSIGIFT